MSTLSTHVLDTEAGRPARGLGVALCGSDGLIAEGMTDADGRWRCPGALPDGAYRLEFALGAWLAAQGRGDGFLDVVPIAFGMAGDGHYHVPLLASAHSYATYRGS